MAISNYSKDVKRAIVPEQTYLRARYDRKLRLRFQNDDLAIRQMRVKDLVPESSANDIYYQIQGYEEYRPDVVANNIYGDPKLYWVILSNNGMRDVFDFKAGEYIVIPALESVYAEGGVLVDEHKIT